MRSSAGCFRSNLASELDGPAALQAIVFYGIALVDSQSAPRLVAHRRRNWNQSGHSSFRQVRGSAGWAFGVRSSRGVVDGATNGAGAKPVEVWEAAPFPRAKAVQPRVARSPSLPSPPAWRAH